ncbi:MAG: CocE/NonD family hydrolase [Bacteroidia bacterium]
MRYLLCLFISGLAFAQNGVLDRIEDLVKEEEIYILMPDSVSLATSIFRPVFSDTVQFDVNLNSLSPGLGTRRIKIADPGVQYCVYPNQPNKYALPLVFTRTPYDKGGAVGLGQAYAALGYGGVLQDMRGRYRSWGVYLPMYSDSWNKNAYLLPGEGHPLDITPNKEANTHEDGYNTLQYLLHQLRYDSDGDGQITSSDSLLCNGRVGMVGASALGNSQYQLAAAHPIDPLQPGLKCLLPIVASGEFYHSTGTHNGVFRERIIDGWLRGQVEFYSGWQSGPANVYDGIHTVADYGPTIQNSQQAAEACIDFWSTENGVHYPNSRMRAIMDISHATLDANGNPAPKGPQSRYENLQVPIMNLTGWWDIFIDGQIQTWQLLMKHLPPSMKKYQKLIIGPFAHQTIGSRSTGDMQIQSDGTDHRYPPNVLEEFNLADFEGADPSQAPKILNSEMIAWFRYFLGTPTIELPEQTDWQYVGNYLGQNIYFRVPADTYQVGYVEFVNFLNGTGPLNRLPIQIKIGSNPQGVQYVDIPATGNSIFGDTTRTPIVMAPREFDATRPGGVKPVRFYVVGPVGDTLNRHVGNYWYHADTFPLANLSFVRLYLHGDGRVDEYAPTTTEVPRAFVADPFDPVPTHGGPNMIVRTPDGQRVSQGQMNFADPLYRGKVLDRPARYTVDGQVYSDLIAFTSDYLPDSFCTAGFPNAEIYMKIKPLSGAFPDSANGDIVVRILDVYPDGREMYVFEGTCNARAREYAESWTTGVEDTSKPWYNLVADSVYKYRFRMLPIAYCWGKGHRIKVLISATNYPRYQPCPNIPLHPGEFLRRRPFENKTYTFHGVTMYPRRNLQTLVFSPQHPSHIELPALGGRFVSSLPFQPSQAFACRIYPNPTTYYAYVEAEAPGNYTLTVQDITGKHIYKADFPQRLVIPTSAWGAGVYVLSISDATGQKVTHKLIVR